MQSLIGSDRFWIVTYEQLCQNPSELLRQISREILHIQPDEAHLATVPALAITNETKDVDQMQSIVKALRSLGVSFTSPFDGRPGDNSRTT